MGTPNFKSNTIWTGDNLPIMRGINSECVDLIYLDPPFNSKADYAAPIGSPAEGAEFKDTWVLNDIDVEWINLIDKKHPKLHSILQSSLTNNNKSYLAYMSIRLLEMKRILKPTGSIYLHCDPTMSHWLKIVMDCIFGINNFGNEIIWHYSAGSSPNNDFKKKHNVIFRYSKNKKQKLFNKCYIPYHEKDHYRFKYVDENGRKYRINHTRNNDGQEKRFYLDVGTPSDDVWSYLRNKELNQIGATSRERTGYPTQKPLALLKRIIEASSNEGDLVLDPFCGCATTLVEADRLKRMWIGIDVSPVAIRLVNQRIRQDREDKSGLWRGKNKDTDRWTGAIERDDIPERTDLGRLPPIQNHKSVLYGEQQGYCAGCNEHFQMRHLEIDHIIAKRVGGTDHKSNLQLLCGNCNAIKGHRGMEYLRVKLKLDSD